MKLLLIAAGALNESIGALGNTTSEHGQLHRARLHFVPLVFECSANSLDDLVHGVRPRVCDPVAAARCVRSEFGAHDSLHKVVDEDHRAALIAGAELGEFAAANHAEEGGLAWWL